MLKFTVDTVLTDDVDLTPRFRIAGVTFDFWETLFMDTPELDRRRDELRCKGLRENLAKMGVEISLEDLVDGLRASTTWLADIWKKAGKYRHSDRFSTSSTMLQKTGPFLSPIMRF